MKKYVKYRNELKRINEAASTRPESFVADTEAAFHRNLRELAEEIAAPQDCRILMMFGPSSSGKTTASHLFQSVFREIGIGSTIISLDDFYRGEQQAPLLPNGQHDYESVEALNVEEIEKCLLGLIETRECDMPQFNFEVRMPYPHRRHVALGEHDIAIVEGIHALNPLVTKRLPPKGVRKIYISVKQGILDGETELFTAHGIRLVRRIVRDYRFRGTRPERTLAMWSMVMEGERKYIWPYRGGVDYTVNSLHLYEPCVLRNQAIPILRQVSEQSAEFPRARELIRGLDRFVSIGDGKVPGNSLLREFIGGGTN